MKKISYLLPLAILINALLFCNSTFAQSNNFAPLGALWHFSTGGPCGPNGYAYPANYFSIESVGDTTIMGNTCRRLEYRNSDSIVTGNKFVYENAGIIYYFNDSSFLPIYNFSAGIGDTVTFSFIGKSSSWQDSIITEVGTIDTIYYDSVGTFPIRHFVTTIDQYGLKYSYMERLGNMEALIWEDWEVPVAGCLPLRRCYQDSALFHRNPLFEPDTLACDYKFTVSTKYVASEEVELLVYPNPARDFINVYVPRIGANVETLHATSLHLHLYDLNGRLLQNHTLPSTDATYMMATEGLKSGGYILQLLDDGGRLLGMEKVVISK